MSYKAQRFNNTNNNFRGGRGGGQGGGNRHFARPRHVMRSYDPTQYIETMRPIKATPVEDFVPVHSFADFDIHPQIKTNISYKNYTKPTPIQDESIPHILAGKDVVGIANTGTGKTAAFLIPLIHKITKERDSKVLIITPTRELAVQIQEEFQAFAQRLGIYSVLCIGGVSIHRQMEKLRRQPQFVIGTPGRLKDLQGRGCINFENYNNIVLDEVDRMLDMGFIHDVKHIISYLPQQRHSLFFSATVTDNVREVMKSFLSDPVTVQVKAPKPAENVQQEVVRLSGRRKVDVLHELLIQQESTKVLVFGRTKWGINKLESHLRDMGHRVTAIHGNKTQNQRQRALNEFKREHVDVLLATDVASRGLDISDVSHVINFDLPETQADYIHRIGRTGRADRSGIALTLVD